MSQKRIAVKLAKTSVAIAFIVGLLLSSLQVYNDYLQEEKSLNQVINRILHVAERSATASVHTLSEELASEVITGLFEYNFIDEAQIIDDLGIILADKKKLESTSSQTQWLTNYISGQYQQYSINLYPPSVKLDSPGQLIIVVDVDAALASFYSRSLAVVVSGIVRNIILVLLLFLAFHYVITRPLIKLAREFKRISSEGETIQLSIPVNHADDEFNLVIRAANELLAENLYHMRELSEQNKALTKSEAHLSTLVRTIPDLIWLKDPNGIYISCNYQFERFFGEKESDIVGKTDYDFVDKDLADSFREKDLAAVVAKQSTSNEEEVVFADGGQSVFLLTVKTPMRDINGQLIGILGIARDITERKQAELELGQVKSYLANIIDSMPSIIIGVDKDKIVTQWNVGAEKASKLSQKNAIGRAVVDVFPRLEAEVSRIQTAIESRQEQSIKKSGYLKDGVITYENITIYPLIANSVEGAVIRIDDATEQVRLEEMMIQSEKMLSIGGLAAGMAHEINNPLAGMMQTSNVLINRLTNKDVQANLIAAESMGTDIDAIYGYMEKRGVFRMLKAINDSGDRVATIVNNMLNFARKSEDIYSSHSINELLDNSIALSSTDYDLKKQYDFRAISIIKNYDENVPLVACDSIKIQQVFLNIFRNGAQAMQDGDCDHPEFKLHTFYDTAHENVCIEIKDNGPGINDEIRKRIFEPFFTTKPIGIGTGLGLSVSYFIITENHNGEMTVESELGIGTQFLISLPVEASRTEF
mgnify:CR=1 FL=1